MLPRHRILPNETICECMVEHFRACTCRQKIYETGFAECINVVEYQSCKLMLLVIAVQNTPANIARIKDLCFLTFIYNPKFNPEYTDDISRMCSELGYEAFREKYQLRANDAVSGWYTLTEEYKTIPKNKIS